MAPGRLCTAVVILLLWLAEVAAAGWLYGLTEPSGYAVLLAVALVTGLVLRTADGVLRWVCGFGAGIVLLLAAGRLAAHDAERGVVATVGLAGAAVAIGSLVGIVKGR